MALMGNRIPGADEDNSTVSRTSSGGFTVPEEFRSDEHYGDGSVDSDSTSGSGGLTERERRAQELASEWGYRETTDTINIGPNDTRSTEREITISDPVPTSPRDNPFNDTGTTDSTESDSGGSSGSSDSGGGFTVPEEFRSDDHYGVDGGFGSLEPVDYERVGGGGGGGLDESADGSTEAGDGVPVEDAQRTPTGIQNPFNWAVEGGDIVAPPPSSVTESGEVAGLETLFGEGGVDLNPQGDVTLNPFESDHQTGSGGAEETAQPDTELSRVAREQGPNAAVRTAVTRIYQIPQRREQSGGSALDALPVQSIAVVGALAVLGYVGYSYLGGA